MKQIEDAKMFGIQGFCKDLLEVNCNAFTIGYIENGGKG